MLKRVVGRHALRHGHGRAPPVLAVGSGIWTLDGSHLPAANPCTAAPTSAIVPRPKSGREQDWPRRLSWRTDTSHGAVRSGCGDGRADEASEQIRTRADATVVPNSGVVRTDRRGAAVPRKAHLDESLAGPAGRSCRTDAVGASLHRLGQDVGIRSVVGQAAAGCSTLSQSSIGYARRGDEKGCHQRILGCAAGCGRRDALGDAAGESAGKDGARRPVRREGVRPSRGPLSLLRLRHADYPSSGEKDVVEARRPGENVLSSWKTMPTPGLEARAVLAATLMRAARERRPPADRVMKERRLTATGRADERDELRLARPSKAHASTADDCHRYLLVG